MYSIILFFFIFYLYIFYFFIFFRIFATLTDYPFIFFMIMMNVKRKTLGVFSLLLFCGTTMAQSVPVEEKPVRRVTFDRENVTIYYQDGTNRANVDAAVIRRTEPTGITEKRTDEGRQKAATAYDLSGRKVSGNSTKKGVYVVKRGNSVRKTIKK